MIQKLETLQRLTIAFAVMLSVAGAVQDWSKDVPSVSADYYQQTPVCGTIEAEYTAMGAYEVSYAEYPALDILIKQYKVWYPSALEEGHPGMAHCGDGQRHRGAGLPV